MSRHRVVYMSCAVSLALLSLAAAGWVRAAQSSAEAERNSWDEAGTAARAVVAQLERLPVSRDGAPLPDRVATLARRVLVTAGIGQEALAGIQPLGDITLPGGAWHRQQVLLQLRGLSTQQAAAAVDAVIRTDPTWAVTSIQLTHTGNDDRYDAGLALTTLYPTHP